MGTLLEGRSDPVVRAISHLPGDDTCLLEVAVDPPGLAGGELRVASDTRVFVLGWDPPQPEQRDASHVTVNGDDDEVVLYRARWVLLGDADYLGTSVASLLGALVREVAPRGARQEMTLQAGAYSRRVHAGHVASLLPAPEGDDDHLAN